MTRKEAPQESALEIIEAQKMDIALRDAVIATLTNT